MANKFNARNIWASVRNSCMIVKNIVGGALFFAIIVVRVIFVYNPIMFPIWVLLGYRKTPAEVLFGKKQDFYDTLWDALPQALCCWEVKHFPWFMKKEFVRMYPDEFSIVDQIRVAIELPYAKKADFIKKLNEEAIDSLWERHIVSCNDIIVGFRSKLNVETLSYLINRSDIVKIKGYINKNTPSTECIQKMIDLTKLPNWKIAAEALHYTALKYGLSAPLIEQVYKNASEESVKIVEKAAVQRNQYAMVRKLRLPAEVGLWREFCEQNPEIWSGAQKEMFSWMFDAYYNTGHKLDECSIMFFLSSDLEVKADIAKFIFENEENLSEKVLTVVRMDPEIYTIYLQSSKVSGVGKV